MFLIYLNIKFLFFINYCHKQKVKHIFHATFLLQSTKWKFNNSNILPKLNVPWTMHHDINFEAITNLMCKYLYSYNITIFYMFRALLCSSSGGQIVYVQHLVPSLYKRLCVTLVNQCNANQCNAQPLIQSDGTRCCTYTIWPPEDEHNNAWNV